MGTAGAGASSRTGGDWFEQPPESPAGPEPGRALVSAHIPSHHFPNCRTASGGKQACAFSALAFDF